MNLVVAAVLLVAAGNFVLGYVFALHRGCRPAPRQRAIANYRSRTRSEQRFARLDPVATDVVLSEPVGENFACKPHRARTGPEIAVRHAVARTDPQASPGGTQHRIDTETDRTLEATPTVETVHESGTEGLATAGSLAAALPVDVDSPATPPRLSPAIEADDPTDRTIGDLPSESAASLEQAVPSQVSVPNGAGSGNSRNGEWSTLVPTSMPNVATTPIATVDNESQPSPKNAASGTVAGIPSAAAATAATTEVALSPTLDPSPDTVPTAEEDENEVHAAVMKALAGEDHPLFPTTAVDIQASAEADPQLAVAPPEQEQLPADLIAELGDLQLIADQILSELRDFDARTPDQRIDTLLSVSVHTAIFLAGMDGSPMAAKAAVEPNSKIGQVCGRLQRINDLLAVLSDSSNPSINEVAGLVGELQLLREHTDLALDLA